MVQVGGVVETGSRMGTEGMVEGNDAAEDNVGKLGLIGRLVRP